MVKIVERLGKREISTERISSSVSDDCIEKILNCFKEYDITVELSKSILDECKLQIEIIGAQASLKDLITN